MAFSTRSSIFFFTTLVLLSTQINARDSYFFGKFHRESPKDQYPNNVLPLETSEKATVEESFPKKKEKELDPTFLPDSENGYGLYGHETTYNNNKEEFNNNNNNNNNKNDDEKFNGETFSTPSLSETEESYNNNDQMYPKKTESYENNRYNNEEFNNNNKYDDNVKEESFSENNEDKRSFYNSNAYGTESERETPYKGYSHNMEERQGMSDTRFMEKGNYYYDLYNDRNHGHFYRKHHQKIPSGYYSSPATENSYDQSYSYGNNNYNSEEEKNFKDPYNSKWEKNMMNEQPEESVQEQGDQFKP
ncbi:F36 [Hirschfeldia incana]|nr:F36 [Hirschfeldia incana]